VAWSFFVSNTRVITTLYHTAAAIAEAEGCIEDKMSAGLSGKHCNADALWVMVIRTPVSPEQV
jgi:hypothetical protein